MSHVVREDRNVNLGSRVGESCGRFISDLARTTLWKAIFSSKVNFVPSLAALRMAHLPALPWVTDSILDTDNRKVHRIVFSMMLCCVCLFVDVSQRWRADSTQNCETLYLSICFFIFLSHDKQLYVSTANTFKTLITHNYDMVWRN